MDIPWFRRRWYDFRQGHGMYLVFAMTFTNFVLIFYNITLLLSCDLRNFVTNQGVSFEFT